jgi:uncharacterized delta-60 repeat protein
MSRPRINRLVVALVFTIAGFTAFAPLASVFAQECEDEQVPGGQGAAAPRPISTASAEIDSSFGTAGMVRVKAPGNTRFMAVAVAPDGSSYGAGFITVNGDQAMAVAKITAAGALDASFGSDGIASVNVSPGKTVELARSIVLQGDKILLGGPIERDVNAPGDAAKDTDIAVVRFDMAGKLDPTWGEGGIAKIDLGTGRVTTGTTFVGDTSWGLGALPGGKVVAFGTRLADGPDRTDTDYVVVGLTSAGAVDPSFGTNGMVVVDLNTSGDNPRNLIVQDDGKIVTSGYSSSGGVVRPVLIRLSAGGVLDASFGDKGVATDTVLDGVTEAYSVTRHGGDYAAAGYGRGADASEKVDLVAYRFHGNGKRDTNFGIANGVTRINIADDDDRARNIIALPDGRLLAAGSGKRTATDIDGMLVLMSQDGKLIETFGEGGKLITDVGGPNDSWYGLALTPDSSAVIVAGFMGADLSGNAGFDEAVVLKIKI